MASQPEDVYATVSYDHSWTRMGWLELTTLNSFF